MLYTTGSLSGYVATSNYSMEQECGCDSDENDSSSLQDEVSGYVVPLVCQ